MDRVQVKSDKDFWSCKELYIYLAVLSAGDSAALPIAQGLNPDPVRGVAVRIGGGHQESQGGGHHSTPAERTLTLTEQVYGDTQGRAGQAED